MASSLLNANPIIYTKKAKTSAAFDASKVYDENECDLLDRNEIFDLIRGINDPEHPLTLEELNVVQEDLISIDHSSSKLLLYRLHEK